MVETRLSHNANRSGTNNVELSPAGDYRGGLDLNILWI